MNQNLRSPGLLALLFVSVPLVFSAGCGDDTAAEPDGHGHTSCGLQENCDNSLEFMHGLAVDGHDGIYTATIMHGDPPSIEDSSWMVGLKNADGDDVTDATITVDVHSVDCGHGGTKPATLDITADADGMYTVEPVFAHGGPWETRLMIKGSDGEDMVHIEFCIPGDAHTGGVVDAGAHAGHM